MSGTALWRRRRGPVRSAMPSATAGYASNVARSSVAGRMLPFCAYANSLVLRVQCSGEQRITRVATQNPPNTCFLSRLQSPSASFGNFQCLTPVLALASSLPVIHAMITFITPCPKILLDLPRPFLRNPWRARPMHPT